MLYLSLGDDEHDESVDVDVAWAGSDGSGSSRLESRMLSLFFRFMIKTTTRRLKYNGTIVSHGHYSRPIESRRCLHTKRSDRTKSYIDTRSRSLFGAKRVNMQMCTVHTYALDKSCSIKWNVVFFLSCVQGLLSEFSWPFQIYRGQPKFSCVFSSYFCLLNSNFETRSSVGVA